MKMILSFLSILVSVVVSAQVDVTLFSERTADGIVIYGKNSESCAVSVNLSLQMENIAPATKQTLFVIPAKAEKHPVLALKPVDAAKRYAFNFRYDKNLGDATLINYDKNYAYALPFSSGAAYRMSQGYNGRLSHAGENSIDFTMPEGTAVTAMRGGVVVKVVENNKSGCPREECKAMNNSIIIYHEDGTFAEYAHLQYMGAQVRVGEKVQAGQMIGLSGNTGWSSGPHLHVAVFRPTMQGRETIQTMFKTESGVVFLKENEEYRKL